MSSLRNKYTFFSIEKTNQYKYKQQKVTVFKFAPENTKATITKRIEIPTINQNKPKISKHIENGNRRRKENGRKSDPNSKPKKTGKWRLFRPQYRPDN